MLPLPARHPSPRAPGFPTPSPPPAVLQLVEYGKIDLDAPIQKYLPDLPSKPRSVTARQLLGHLGGIRHYKDATESYTTHHYGSLTEALSVFKDDPLLYEPGSKYTYTTFGFVLLGAIVERASGLPYLDYMQQNVFRPAGMTTIQDDSVYRVIQNRTHGYSRAAPPPPPNAALHDTTGNLPGGRLSSDP